MLNFLNLSSPKIDVFFLFSRDAQELCYSRVWCFPNWSPRPPLHLKSIQT
uniref:Uncharacterized protein n=1 Tax=Periophthalmus magnuspinnatus TaxID=409849 RepID=A0A3B3ZQG0_9GOBI